MYFDYLRYIVEIVEEGSIGKASEKCHISQPGLSRILKTVENDFQINIFDRSHNGVSLTKDGEIFLRFVHDVLDQYIIVWSKLHPIKNEALNFNGEIDIYLTPGTSFFPSINLIKAIELFQSLYSNVKIYVQILEAQEILRNLEEDTTNSKLAFLIVPYSHEKKSMIEDFHKIPQYYELTPIHIFQYMAMVGKSSHLANKKQLSVKTLLKEPISVLTSTRKYSDTALIHQLEHYGKPKISTSSASPQLWLSPIANGQAISFSSSIYDPSIAYRFDSDNIDRLLNKIQYIKIKEPLEACSACLCPKNPSEIISLFLSLLNQTIS